MSHRTHVPVSRSGALVVREVLSCPPAALLSLVNQSSHLQGANPSSQPAEVSVRTDWNPPNGVVALDHSLMSSWLVEAGATLRALSQPSESL